MSERWRDKRCVDPIQVRGALLGLIWLNDSVRRRQVLAKMTTIAFDRGRLFPALPLPSATYTVATMVGVGKSLPLCLHRKSDNRSPQASNPPNLATSAALPPEILDDILANIPTDNEGQPTLIACALVATSWTAPSQRRLFSSVLIREDKYQRWMNGVVLSASKARLLGYVRSLWHCSGVYVGVKFPMQSLPRLSGKYLPALRNLQALTLYNIKIEHINEEGFHTCFSAFRETLTYLSLETFATSFSAFVTLVDYFPNLRTLQLRALELEPDGGPVPPLSRPLRGELHFYEIEPWYLEFLGQFSKLDLQYEELVIGCTFVSVEARFLGSALQISPNTIKSLRLTGDFGRE